MVKRLRRRPLTAETGVRFPMGLPHTKGVPLRCAFCVCRSMVKSNPKAMQRLIALRCVGSCFRDFMARMPRRFTRRFSELYNKRIHIIVFLLHLFLRITLFLRTFTVRLWRKNRAYFAHIFQLSIFNLRPLTQWRRLFIQ